MNDNLILFLAVVVLIFADFAIRNYSKYKTAKGTEDTKDDQEVVENILKEFLGLLNTLSLKAIEIIDVKNLNLSDEEFNKFIAEEAVTLFETEVQPSYSGTTTGTVLQSIPRSVKVEFVLHNILSQEGIIERIKDKLSSIRINKEVEAVVNEPVTEEETNLKAEENADMLDNINKYYE